MARPMRVAFFVGAFPMTSETFVVNAAKTVLEAGHHLDIYGVDPMFRTDTEVQEEVARFGMVERTHSPDVPMGAGKLAGLARAFGRTLARDGPGAFRLLTTPSPDGLRTAARAIFDASALQPPASYDVIHVHFGALAARVLHLRRTGRLHGRVLVHFRGGDISAYVRKHGEGVYRHVFREADHFVANCAFFRDKAVRLGAPADRIDVLPSGLDTSKFPFAPRALPGKGPVRLISVGRLVPKKGFSDAIEAVARLGPESSVTYTIIGEGPLREELEAKAQARGVADRVSLPGAKSLDSVAEALFASHLFLGPSVTAPDGNQDAPINTLKEAMASGLPVIATRHGGIPELVEDGASGLLVPEASPDALAAGIRTLLSCPARWPAMGRAGADRVLRDYDLQKTGRQMLDIYDRLVRSPKEQTGMNRDGRTPRATVVVTPRERFGMAKASLESLFEQTDEPFDLVYVDAGTPRRLKRWLEAQAEARGFTLLSHPTVLPPNSARNLGLRAAHTDYVVFVDNDVIFSKGWLRPLIECGDEEGADVIAPLTCEGPEIHKVVHQAGGEYTLDRESFFAAPAGERQIADIMHHHKVRLDELPPLERSETGVCEFHCVMVRRSVFDRIGPLDEAMVATKEHMDLCMSVHAAGGTVFFEPRSVVTYLFPTRHHAMEIGDFPFFLVRWSPDWQRASLEHFRAKWGLKEDDYFRGRYGKLGWRRREGVSRTVLKKIPGLGANRSFVDLGTKLVDPVAALAAKTLVWRQARRNRTAKQP